MPSIIDLMAVLRRTVSERYDDLVTRRTGQAVRYGIEQDLTASGDHELAIIDFSSVRCLDFSCADEIVGKLLLEHGSIRFFLLRGVTVTHQTAIEQILANYGLAVVAQDRAGQLVVLGTVSETVRRAFAQVAERGVDAGVGADDLDLPGDTAEHAINELVERRLVCRLATDNRVVSFI